MAMRAMIMGETQQKKIPLSTALTKKKKKKKRKRNKQQHSSDKKTGRRRRRRQQHPGSKFGAQFDLLIHRFWCARIPIHNQICCLLQHRRRREREREEREERRRAIFKVINPGIFPVINNIWLVGY
jgi:hypothetical protein